ncbi:MAG: biopolymer transporter ExbD [Calditrichaeota bacterium]|nr:biopolymer transporter ExbD [Candidatus Cloacimonadota bacterium]MCA9787058.1 biopolymer transporter ExbD [Candidatus Cloacimonadota bacterium]MCB1046006.1 biopolymer transporter ExbD [Calditrichota bacterium]MCB9473108.1 biopolymer transporter ExbD [Candidatus Delongbacteria bacterium]
MLLEKRRKIESEIPAASMADIAFLLLVFFLVTTTIDQDKGVPLTLPEISEEPPKVLNKDKVLNILVSNAGEIMINDAVLDQRGQLRSEVKNSLEELGRDAEGKYEKIVSIKTQAETLYDDYIFVLDQVKMAGATKISIAEPEE